MDFQIPPITGAKGNKPRHTIVLACSSKAFFAPYIRQTGAEPLLWTTGLMAPEAYTLKSALDGWIAGENDEAIRRRAAQAYNRYQKCGELAASRLFATGYR
jgi:phage-related baseplate assembly protein